MTTADENQARRIAARAVEAILELPPVVGPAARIADAIEYAMGFEDEPVSDEVFFAAIELVYEATA